MEGNQKPYVKINILRALMNLPRLLIFLWCTSTYLSYLSAFLGFRSFLGFQETPPLWSTFLDTRRVYVRLDPGIRTNADIPKNKQSKQFADFPILSDVSDLSYFSLRSRCLVRDSGPST